MVIACPHRCHQHNSLRKSISAKRRHGFFFPAYIIYWSDMEGDGRKQVIKAGLELCRMDRDMPRKESCPQEGGDKNLGCKGISATPSC